MLERDIQKKVRRYAEYRGWLTYKWSGVNMRGVPDCIFISPKGEIIFIEFKATKGKPTPNQLRVHKKLAANNVHVYIVDSVEDGKFIIDLYTV